MAKEPKKQYKVNSRPIFILFVGLTFFTVILVITLMETAKESRPATKQNQKYKLETGQSKVEEDTDRAYDKEILAVVKALDSENQQLTLFDIETQEERILNFNGATDIRDKYNQIIAAGQIPVGAMVEAAFDSKNDKLIILNISTRAWEYIGSSNYTIHRDEQTITLGNVKYKFTDGLVIINDGIFVTINDVTQPDELTIRGYDQTIWSIEVTRGHGTVKLVDVKAFSGGTIAIGYEAIQQVSEDLLLIAREGNFNLTVENGDYSATKNITINRNHETIVSLADVGPNATKRGYVTFEIKPFGADLLIDGELVFYGSPVELPYGEHDLKVSLGGYTPYQGVLEVDSTAKTIRVNLPEKSSNKSVDITETVDNVGNGSEYSEWTLPEEEDESQDQNNESGSEDDSDEEYLIDDEHAIYIQNPAGASVYLNGEFLGISPGSFAKIIGKHVFTFIREGYETKSYTVEVLNDGQDAYISMPNLIPKTE